MRYYITDFFRWEQQLINKLRENGYFVYGLRDCGGIHFSIEKHVIVNNIGFLVADKELPLVNGSMSDADLTKYGPESPELIDEIEAIRRQISNELEKAKAEYEAKEEAGKAIWDDLIKIQENRRERDMHYKLSLRKDNPVISADGYGLQFQTIYSKDDETQEVMYFIRDPHGKIIIDSTKEKFKLNARYKKMAKDIFMKHGITA